MQVSYDDFINRWNGQQVTDFGGECVSLIAKFLQENNLPIFYGNANQYADNPLMQEHFDWTADNPSDPNQLPQRGDIVVWDGNSPYSGGSGHIAFFDHQLENHQFMSFGQNSGGSTAHMQPHSWDHVAGWWHYREPVAPAPPAPDPYTLTDIPAMRVIINKQTSRWNMGYSDLDQMKANPVESLGQGAGPYSVSVLCHQNGSGYDYYLENRNNLGGFNVYDCAPYVEPIVLPADIPVPPRNWASAPISAASTTQYEVVKLVDGYETSIKAANHIQPAVAPVGAGQYYIFNKRFADGNPNQLVALNVTQTLGQPGYWINPDDNTPDVIPEPVVVEPVTPVIDYEAMKAAWAKLPTITPEVTPKGNPVNPNWRASYRPFKDASGKAYVTDYEALIDFYMHDLEGQHKDAPVVHGQRIVMAGQFLGPDNVLYGMPQESREDSAGEPRYWYFGCPLDKGSVMKESELYDATPFNKIEKQALAQIHDVEARQHKANLEARNVIARNNLRISDNVIHSVVQVETFGRKFMDFFTFKKKQ